MDIEYGTDVCTVWFDPNTILEFPKSELIPSGVSKSPIPIYSEVVIRPIFDLDDPDIVRQSGKLGVVVGMSFHEVTEEWRYALRIPDEHGFEFSAVELEPTGIVFRNDQMYSKEFIDHVGDDDE